MVRLTHFVIGLGLVFWPLNLFLANTPGDFIGYAFPTLLLITSFILYRRRPGLYFVPILVIPFVEPKLALLPLLLAMFDFLRAREKRAFFFLLLSLATLVVLSKSFFGQTVFTPDHEARQEVIRKTHLYPSIFTARLFQNKARIYLDKVTFNFFALTDPNNYFFGFHPRQIVDNQDLVKYPVVGLGFVLFGIYYLGKSRDKMFIINTSTGSLISLSLLTIFDRNDFILWVPLSLVFVYGVKKFDQRFKNKAKIFFWLFIVFSTVELVKFIAEFSR